MKKIYFILFFVLLVSLFYLIISKTYALLETNSKLTADIDLGVWNVKVNDTIINNDSINFNITDFNWSTDSNVLEGKFAPGIEGYFVINIDPTGSDVSLKYDIDFDLSNLIEHKINIVSITEEHGNNLIRTAESTYTGVIPLTDINNSVFHSIKVYLKWDGDSTGDDASVGMSSSAQLDLPIEINLIQYLGEDIEEYIEEESSSE